MNKTVLILGGYGNTGYLIARFLLHMSDANIIIAGRNEDKAKITAEKLNIESSNKRVQYLHIDAENTESLRQGLSGVDFLVVASSTTAYMKHIINISIEMKVDYLDVNISNEKIEYLKSQENKIKETGLCFVTDGGFHPGLPSAMVRYIAQDFEKIISANIYSCLKLNWGALSFSDSTIVEFVDEFRNYQAFIFQNKSWRLAKSSDYLKFDFGTTFGKKSCFPMNLEEMKELPILHPSLEETGFYVSGFNWAANIMTMLGMYIIFPIFRKSKLKWFANLFAWSLQKLSKPPFGCLLILNTKGIKEGNEKEIKLSIFHEDGYVLTAVPVAACIKQILDGSIKKPGVWFQANIVEPNRFMDDLVSMGIEMIKK